MSKYNTPVEKFRCSSPICEYDFGSCPGHEIRISFCRSTDTVAIYDKDENIFCVDDDVFGAIMKLIKNLPEKF